MASTGFDWLMTGSNRGLLKHENTRSRSVHGTALLCQLSKYWLLLKDHVQYTSLIIFNRETQRHASYMLCPQTVTEMQLPKTVPCHCRFQIIIYASTNDTFCILKTIFP
jgi:hypothetical protein